MLGWTATRLTSAFQRLAAGPMKSDHHHAWKRTSITFRRNPCQAALRHSIVTAAIIAVFAMWFPLVAVAQRPATTPRFRMQTQIVFVPGRGYRRITRPVRVNTPANSPPRPKTGSPSARTVPQTSAKPAESGTLASRATTAQELQKKNYPGLTVQYDRPTGILLALNANANANANADGQIPAEFETQRALMVSVCDWQPHHQSILQQLAVATEGHTNLLILVRDSKHRTEVRDWLDDADCGQAHLFFSQLESDTVWIRDFGPIFRRDGDSFELLDFLYEGTRPKDETLPSRYAQQGNQAPTPVRWTVQGGNWLTNGKGIAVASTRLFKDNYIRFPQGSVTRDQEFERRQIVVDAFCKACNVNRLIVLPPLQNEGTGHVDMFATFISPQDIVVASVDPRADPANARLLDMNARQLDVIPTADDDTLRVHRIKVPTRSGQSWSSYTNIVLANDLLMMPVYDSDPVVLVENAKRTYQRLLPDHTIKTINMTSMQQLGGALHCLTLNIPDGAPIPQRLIPVQTK